MFRKPKLQPCFKLILNILYPKTHSRLCFIPAVPYQLIWFNPCCTVYSRHQRFKLNELLQTKNTIFCELTYRNNYVESTSFLQLYGAFRQPLEFSLKIPVHIFSIFKSSDLDIRGTPNLYQFLRWQILGRNWNNLEIPRMSKIEDITKPEMNTGIGTVNSNHRVDAPLY